MEQSLENYKKDYILFVESGFIAVNQGDEDAAIKLFKAAELLEPTNLLPQVGFGYMHLCKLELKQACKIFEEVLSKDPSNDMAKAFLGISFSLMPNEVAKGEKVLEEVSTNAKDGQIKSLADTAIDFVEKFVKKSPTPTQAQTQKPTEKKKT
jgi:tetratricopeptide (TPR) repeat protein